MQDRISVLTPTFNAKTFLRRAIDSMLTQSNGNWEMLVSPDDGQCYDYLQKIDPRIRVVPSSAIATGPALARNRGLALASGKYVATLDDDDTLEANFVEEVLAALKSHKFVTAPTKYFNESGELIRTIGSRFSEIDIPTFSKELGSMLVIGPRDCHPTWKTGFAEDVLHTCETIDRSGGMIAVVRSTAYRCTVRTHSACNIRSDIDEQYGMRIAALRDGMSAKGLSQTRELFAYRRKINALFAANAESGLAYHQFVRDPENLCPT